MILLTMFYHNNFFKPAKLAITKYLNSFESEFLNKRNESTDLDVVTSSPAITKNL